MQSRRTLLKLGVVALVVSALVVLFPAIDPHPAAAQFSTCPAGYQQVATFNRYPGGLYDALVLDVDPVDDYGFNAPANNGALLVVTTFVGHTELGCPGGSSPICSYPDQTNEHFFIKVDGSQVAYITDPGDHQVTYMGSFPFALSEGAHTITFEHAAYAVLDGRSTSNDVYNSSVGYSVGLCIQPPPPPPPGNQGCTLGYWKNHLGSWEGYASNQTLESVFDVPDSLGIDNDTLLTALNYGGGNGVAGGARILLKQAVACLLNAASGGVAFPLSTGDVIAESNAALASLNRDTMIGQGGTFDGLNNLGCPLN